MVRFYETKGRERKEIHSSYNYYMENEMLFLLDTQTCKIIVPEWLYIPTTVCF
jgi:hypothetical protein